MFGFRRVLLIVDPEVKSGHARYGSERFEGAAPRRHASVRPL